MIKKIGAFMALKLCRAPIFCGGVFYMNDIVQYFVGAICPIFDNVMSDWKTHVEIVCVYSSAVCLMALVTLYVVLSTVKACITAFARHVGGAKNV